MSLFNLPMYGLSLQVCDFGLSRMQHHTFLSSKSIAGTVMDLNYMKHTFNYLFSLLISFFMREREREREREEIESIVLKLCN